ncbi:hypothetical protein ACFY00_29180 [Kitasatospora sp. NPDC001540]|uniref:hypothetical protein n=1 Tax=Kitasatospora sp. NPDC001540 TaxID=3364014 RepID=UPI00368E9608
MSHPHHPPYGAPPLPGAQRLPEVAHLLPPGEQPRGVVDADLCDLVRRPPRRYRNERSGRAAEAAFGCLFVFVNLAEYLADLLEDCTWGLIRSLRRLFRGRGLTGGWESQAGRFARAVRGADNDYENDDVLLLFTDRRILLAGSGDNTPADRRAVRVLGELPYAHLRRVEPRHTWISSRVDLHFADGSLLALEVYESDLAALVALGPR